MEANTLAAIALIVGFGSLFVTLRRQNGNTPSTVSRVTELERELAIVRQEIADLRRVNSVVIGQNGELNIEKEQLRTEKEVLRSTVWDLQQEIRDVKRQNDELRHQIDGLQTALRKN